MNGMSVRLGHHFRRRRPVFDRSGAASAVKLL